MIDINEIMREIDNLNNQIYSLTCIKNRLQYIVDVEINNTYNNFIPIIDKYLNKELDKKAQNKLWNELNKHKISDVLKHLSNIYNTEYKKSDNAEWLLLTITRKEDKTNV